MSADLSGLGRKWLPQTDRGTELTEPVHALTAAGARVTILSIQSGESRVSATTSTRPSRSTSIAGSRRSVPSSRCGALPGGTVNATPADGTRRCAPS